MPVYYIQHPEDAEKRAILSNLIASLEKLNGLTTFDAIGVILPVGDPAEGLIKYLSRDVVGAKEALPAIPKPEVKQEFAGTNICRNCGKTFEYSRVTGARQVFCSPFCRSQWHTSKNREHKRDGIAGGNGDGSGIIHGKLTLGKNR